MSWRPWIVAGALAALIMSAVVPGGGGRAVAASGGTLTIAASADYTTLDPAIYYDLPGSPLQSSVYEGLLRYAGNNRLQAALATAWSSSSHGLTYTFFLRRGVRFQDGEPFNAAAVKLSWQREAALGGGPSYMVTEIKKIITPNPYKVVVHIAIPDIQFLSYQASLWGPKIVCPNAVKQHKSAGDPWAKTWFTSHACGTGPYRLTSYQRGQQYTLKPFSGYWGHLPSSAPSSIVIKIVPSTETQLLLLRQGQINMITHELPYSQVAALKKTSGITVRTFPSPKYWTVYMNTRHGPLANVKVRRALSYALDRNPIIRGIMFGFATVPQNTYPSGELPGARSLPGFKLAKARSMLKTAHVGHLHLTYTYAAERPVWGQVGQALKDQLSKVGVTVDIKALTTPAMFGQILSPGHASDLMGIDVMGDTALPVSWSYVSWDSKGPLNFSSLKDPTLDKLINVANEAGHPARSAAANRSIDARVVQDAPAFFIAWPKEYIVTTSNVAGYSYVPIVPWTPSPWTLKMRS